RSAAPVLVLLLLRPAGSTRKRGAREPLAFLPALRGRRPPAVYGRGDGSLRRGVVAARRGHRNDQLLPGLGAPEEPRRPTAPDLDAHTGHLGAARQLPQRGSGRARPR